MAVDFTVVSNGDLQCASHGAALDLTGSAMVVRQRHERWPDAERARIMDRSNRVFTSHDNIVDHCCEAWNKRGGLVKLDSGMSGFSV